MQVKDLTPRQRRLIEGRTIPDVLIAERIGIAPREIRTLRKQLELEVAHGRDTDERVE